VLVEGRLTDLPAGFVAAPAAVGARDGAVASLIRRKVMRPTEGADPAEPVPAEPGPAEPVPAVAGNLYLLRRAALSVRLDITGRAGARRGWFAVGSGFVAGVLTLPGGGLELSLAPDARLGIELARAVPDASAVTGPGFSEGASGEGPVRCRRLPLGLLDDVAAPKEGGSQPSPDQSALAEELRRRTAGSLSCLVLGRAGSTVGAGQVAWLATDGGWCGLRPVVDGSPRRLVDVLPVQPADLGTWVAPAVAALLEAPDERT
jgi:hypothetical protein